MTIGGPPIASIPIGSTGDVATHAIPMPFNTSTTREQILAGVFAIFSGVYPFKTTSRRLKLWGEVPSEMKPALFMIKTGEDRVNIRNQPPVIRFEVELFIYTYVGAPNVTGDTPPPSKQLDDILDTIDVLLTPPPLVGAVTLGGLVNSCWIEGKTLIVPGDLDGDGLAVVPLRILIPS